MCCAVDPGQEVSPRFSIVVEVAGNEHASGLVNNLDAEYMPAGVAIYLLLVYRGP